MYSFFKKYWQYAVALLFALAIGLGMLQAGQDPYQDLSHSTAPAQKGLEAYYEESRQLIKQQSAETTVTFFAAGDIMLSRSVALAIQKSATSSLPFTNMAHILRSTDFNFANLESPVSGSPYFNKTGSLVFNAPEEYAKSLQDYNFQVLNLANNHALDQGYDGLVHTIEFLDALGIKHTGVGKTLEAAWQPVAVVSNGIKICFIGASYASVNDNGKTTNDYVARIEDTKNLQLKIQNSRSLCDFVVVTMHAGTEYTRTPNQAQVNFAHTAIDAGADMVIGAHSHWVQTIERYCPNTPLAEGSQQEAGTPGRASTSSVSSCAKPAYIFYGLGNFIFDQEWSQETKEGLTLKIQVSNSTLQNPIAPGAADGQDLQGSRQSAKLKQIELIPVIIENYSTPRPATLQESKKILEKIGETNTILQ